MCRVAVVRKIIECLRIDNVCSKYSAVYLTDAYKMVLEERLMVKDIRAVISKKTKQKSEERDHDQDKDNVKNKEAATNVESDERAARGHWKHPLDFLFSCISVSVGLGSKYSFNIELHYQIQYVF